MAQQAPVLKEALDAMHIPRYALAGWGADDLIGAIAGVEWDAVVCA